MIEKTEFGWTGSITDLPPWGRNPEMAFVAALVAVQGHITKEQLTAIGGHMLKEELAARLYTVYCKAVGGIAFNGDPLPDWVTFSADPKKTKQVEGWLDVAQEAAQALQLLPLTPQEVAKGRSANYHQMSPEDQWAEDKRLGILDWDGK